MYLFLADANIAGATITGNFADWSGGAAYVSGDPNSSQYIAGTVFRNCLITRNVAHADGGGISSNWYAEPTIVNSTIADNVVIGVRAVGGGPSAVVCTAPMAATLTLSILLSGTTSAAMTAPRSQWVAGTPLIHCPERSISASATSEASWTPMTCLRPWTSYSALIPPAAWLTTSLR
jgi:hypothetical protein